FYAFETLSDSLAFEKPVDPESIGANKLVQRARRFFPVEIDAVIVCNDAQFGEVEVRVRTLERIERPRDARKTFCEGVLALGQFQLVTDAMFSELREHCEHV